MKKNTYQNSISFSKHRVIDEIGSTIGEKFSILITIAGYTAHTPFFYGSDSFVYSEMERIKNEIEAGNFEITIIK